MSYKSLSPRQEDQWLKSSLSFHIYYVISRETSQTSCLLIHHATRRLVTVIKEEIVVGAAGRHKVSDGLPPLEVSFFNNLQWEKQQIRSVWAFILWSVMKHEHLHEDLPSSLNSCVERRRPPCQRRCRIRLLCGWATESRRPASLWGTNKLLIKVWEVPEQLCVHV